MMPSGMASQNNKYPVFNLGSSTWQYSQHDDGTYNYYYTGYSLPVNVARGPLVADVEIVGGGGGGGSSWYWDGAGGGGGGGAVVSQSSLPIPVGSNPFVAGAGASGSDAGTSYSGSPSTFLSYTAPGGGRGTNIASGSGAVQGPTTGGGGGGGGNGSSGGAAGANGSFSGGFGGTYDFTGGGGGGGSASAGSDRSGRTGGNGGVSRTVFNSGAALANIVSGFIGGGGGGGSCGKNGYPSGFGFGGAYLAGQTLYGSPAGYGNGNGGSELSNGTMIYPGWGYFGQGQGGGGGNGLTSGDFYYYGGGGGSGGLFIRVPKTANARFVV